MFLNSVPKPLVDLKQGQSARVVAITGPGGSLRLRLRTLGLRPGAHVKLVCRGPGGPLLLEVDGCRIALGRALARRILVAPETEDQG